MNNTATSSSFVTDIVEWKPRGRGRRFDRLARGLARRMRLPWVRKVRWEKANPQSQWWTSGNPTYGHPWTSDHCLANFSFACTCHKGERYDRRRGR